MTTLTLTTPITFGSETITELHFQDMKAKYIWQLPKDYCLNDIRNIASSLAGVVPKVLDELSPTDAFRVIDLVNGFFPRSLEITPEK